MATTPTVNVIVVVPPRDGHKGFWSLGRTRPGKGKFFPTGSTEFEATPEELAELNEDATPKRVLDSGEPNGQRSHPGFLTVVELDPATLAKRHADATAIAARQAADALDRAKAAAEATATQAREAASIAAATERAEQGRARK